MSVVVNGERHTTELSEFDARGRRVVPSNAGLLMAEVIRAAEDEMAKVILGRRSTQ